MSNEEKDQTMQSKDAIVEEKKEEVKPEVTKNEVPKVPQTDIPQRPKRRQIVIETDGNAVIIVKDESAGVLEKISIFQALLSSFVNKQ